LKGKHNEAIKHLEARIQSVTAAEEAAKKEHELAMKRNAQTTDDLKRSIASLEERLKQVRYVALPS
jgi:tripartite-type tricarboxylate transporter receptor subunit TctC